MRRRSPVAQDRASSWAGLKLPSSWCAVSAQLTGLYAPSCALAESRELAHRVSWIDNLAPPFPAGASSCRADRARGRLSKPRTRAASRQRERMSGHGGATNSIPPLDGEGGALLERAGWGETAPPPRRRKAPPDLPTRGRYKNGERAPKPQDAPQAADQSGAQGPCRCAP
jgi:hypothetical protein